MPAEIRDFELMGGADIAWSWREYQETPLYVRRFCWDLMVIKRRCLAERANRGKPGGPS